MEQEEERTTLGVDPEHVRAPDLVASKACIRPRGVVHAVLHLVSS